MPRALPDNPALIVEGPAPLEPHVGFPHVVLPFPVDDLLAYGGLNRLPAPLLLPVVTGRPRPAEPESAL